MKTNYPQGDTSEQYMINLLPNRGLVFKTKTGDIQLIKIDAFDWALTGKIELVICGISDEEGIYTDIKPNEASVVDVSIRNKEVDLTDVGTVRRSNNESIDSLISSNDGPKKNTEICGMLLADKFPSYSL